MSAQFESTPWIWKDGEFIRWEEATLHVMAHVVHYGSSVFEGLRCYSTPDGPAIFRLDDHISRFFDSCRIYRMEPSCTQEGLEAACRQLVDRNQLKECYLRPISFRGYGAAGLDPFASPVGTYVICWPWGAYLGSEALEQGVDACVSTWNRPAPNTYPALAKAGGHYLNSQLMKMEAAANGYAEAIALGPDGLVSEGSGQNLFVVKNGILSTPPADGTILLGITRDSIITLAQDEGMEVREELIPRERLYTADELFFTGTAAEVTPIRSVDRISVGGGGAGPVTRTLQRRFLDVARGTEADPYGWRSYCSGAPAFAAVEVA
jgi:branched-chain amino acid aminotransferase